MNKTFFKDLLNYLKNRPEERRQLAEVLMDINTSSNEEAMVNAKTAGEAIDKSSSWMRTHLQLFPSAIRTTSGKWMFNKQEVINQYNLFCRR